MLAHKHQPVRTRNFHLQLEHIRNDEDHFRHKRGNIPRDSNKLKRMYRDKQRGDYGKQDGAEQTYRRKHQRILRLSQCGILGHSAIISSNHRLVQRGYGWLSGGYVAEFIHGQHLINHNLLRRGTQHVKRLQEFVEARCHKHDKYTCNGT